MSDLSDETLLDLYFAGDAEAFQVFFERHAGRVVGYAMSKGLKKEIALEVRQDAFFRLHKSIHSYEKGRPALTWFFTIVHNCVVDALRQIKGLADLREKVTTELGNRSLTFESQKNDQSSHAIAMLSDEQKQVFEMRVFKEYSFAEISVAIGKNEASLRKIFERARKKIKDILSEED